MRTQARQEAVDKTEGVRPAMQARSLKKRHDLLKAGRKLLHLRVLEEISIKDICAEANCTVGSFYSRFEDKESFFDALIAESCHELLAQAAEQFDNRNWEGVHGRAICDEVVGFLVSIFQGEYSSILTEAFIRESKGFIDSTPMRDVGIKFISTVYVPLERHIDKTLNPDPLRSLSFAIQVVYGALHNARLRDSGPVKFKTPEFKKRLQEMVSRHLGIPPQQG
ncbi:MAG TPA: TetR/AcrR family transcriptional regulator [Limnobacter sp.]|nr:TetR/AcrR family transcriptional regulator [Limnobacter sp.]